MLIIPMDALWALLERALENGRRRRVEDTWSIPSRCRWYHADRPAPITTASYTRTVVQQRTGRVGSDGPQRLSVASSSSRASLCGLRIA
jgi:hypothetical protein